jgi:hypothetical protein
VPHALPSLFYNEGIRSHIAEGKIMMLAQWNIDAKFGHKSHVIESLKKWQQEIGCQIGWTDDKVRMITGSIGVPESRICNEVVFENMAELDASWKKLGDIPAHAQWSKELEPFVVSGSMYWQIYRIL